MSKKMLKRSLALGALMAFVITGSAMAAEEVNTPDKNVNYTGVAYDNAHDTKIQFVGSEITSGTYDVTNENGVSYKVNVNAEQNDGKQNGGVFAFRINNHDSVVNFDTDVVAVAETSVVGTGNNSVIGISNYAGTLNFKDSINVKAVSTNKEGKSVYAISGNGDKDKFAVIKFNEDNEEGVVVKVTAESNTDRAQSSESSVDKNYRGEVVGIAAAKTNITASENTDIYITVKSFGTEVGGDGSAVADTNKKTNDLYGASYAYGILNEVGTVTLNGYTEIDVTSKAAKAYGVKVIDGVYTSTEGTADGNANTTFNDVKINVVNEHNDGYAAGMYACERLVSNGEDSQINVNGNADITVTAGAEAYGVLAGGNGNGNATISLGTSENESVIKVNVTAKDATGIMARGQNGNSEDGSVVNVNGKLLDIDVTGQGAGAYGIYVANGTDGAEDKVETPNVDECQPGLTQVNINTETTKIVVKGTTNEIGTMGIMNVSQGSLNINSNLEVTADNVLVTRGKAVTNINVDKDGNAVLGKSTVLTGNIAFDYDADTSGSAIDTTVNISLDGTGSSWTGNTVVYRNNVLVTERAFDENGNIVCGDPNLFTVSNFNLDVSNGANWTTDSNSFVNKLTVGGSDASLNLVGETAHTVLIGDATFKDGSKLYIKNGDNYLASTTNYALEVGRLTVENGAKIEIGGIAEGETYNIAKGVNATKAVGEKWTIDNNLLTGTWDVDANVNGLQVTTKAKDAGQIAEDMGVDSGTASALGSIIQAANSDSVPDTEAAQNVVKFAQEIANASPEVAAAAAEAVIKMAEAGGNSATAANIVKNVTGVTNDRLSFNCGHSAPHKGGHGVGLFEEGSGADIWAEYVHGKDKVEDMKSTAGATSYEGQYNGFVMGVDFKKVNKFQSGIAFNYGEGDTNTVGSAVRTRSDYDFWGVGYYGNIHNDDSNVIFDINYAQTDSEVTQKNLTGDIEASPETTTWSAGVKLEKLYQNENVQIVPYTGLRYMSIDPDDYATKCGTYKYSMDRQDIWLLPVGVSIRQEIANDNGWTVSPRVDLSYIWAFGDTDSNMEFATALNTKTNIGYDVMDDGSFLGLVGIEAHKGQWGYGVSYSYQKGDHSESKKWYVDVNYSF